MKFAFSTPRGMATWTRVLLLDDGRAFILPSMWGGNSPEGDGDIRPAGRRHDFDDRYLASRGLPANVQGRFVRVRRPVFEIRVRVTVNGNSYYLEDADSGERLPKSTGTKLARYLVALQDGRMVMKDGCISGLFVASGDSQLLTPYNGPDITRRDGQLPD